MTSESRKAVLAVFSESNSENWLSSCWRRLSPTSPFSRALGLGNSARLSCLRKSDGDGMRCKLFFKKTNRTPAVLRMRFFIFTMWALCLALLKGCCSMSNAKVGLPSLPQTTKSTRC
ncbi:hypothetical protein D9M68_852760 [compost metagenome]